jgi:hypothetical protein
MATRRTPEPVKGFAATRGRRGVVKRAANDAAGGRENTDCRGEARTAQPDCPRPSRPKANRRRSG